MLFSEIFKDAKFVAAPEGVFPVIEKTFYANKISKATLFAIGFGTYECRINGQRVDDELLHPLNTDFEERKDHPVNQKTRHRIYVDTCDVTRLIKDGENKIEVTLANGWYTGVPYEVPFGGKKACFRIEIDGGNDVVSDETCTWTPSAIIENIPTRTEKYDYTRPAEAPKPVIVVKEPDSDWLFSDCPRDKVEKELSVTKIKDGDGYSVYDCGENISGAPVIVTETDETAEIFVYVAEKLTKDGELHPNYMHGQEFYFKTAKKGMVLTTDFSFAGFRYLKIVGPAKPVSVRKIHCDIPVTSDFECDDENLNWLYKTYLNTQLCNMHQGIPSDCPQIERRGYTGDGQLMCETAMMTLDARKFYDKWIEDISDCQDEYSGHVQYTAPYSCCGGGPGGWGGAIVIVPYIYYKMYGDDKFLRKMYPQMLRYFDFLEAHSKDALVISDYPDEAWCLGEWCTPGPVMLPAPFVNNYFYVRTMLLVKEIEKIIGYRDESYDLDAKIEERQRATRNAYYNKWDGNFIGGYQGANAFALEMGLGDNRTVNNMRAFYRENPHYDTGIFGTEMVTRFLFEQGDGETAYRMLTASEPDGFIKWKNDGATTLYEEWNMNSRSLSHPMFGAVISDMFKYIVGIRQEADSVAYKRVRIAPVLIDALSHVRGYITVPDGKISVEFEKKQGGILFKIEIPAGIDAVLAVNGREIPVSAGSGEYFIEN